MNLYLLRHGIAADLGEAGTETDAERPLTSKGERRLREAAEAVRELEIEFDSILSSPLLRARQTAEIIAEALGLRTRLALSEGLSPGQSPAHLVSMIKGLKPTPRDLLLVGHEPGLSALISLLVCGAPGMEIEMKKGGLCKLSAEKLSARQCARLEWLLTPRQLSAIKR